MRKKELTSLMITVIVIKMLLSYPVSAVKNAGQAAWIEILYASVLALALFFITAKVYRLKKDLITIAETVGKKPLKIIVGLVIFLILLLNFSSTARIFPESVKVILLQNDRIENIIIGFAVVTVIGAYMGIKSLSRVNFMFLPVAGIVFAGFLLLLFPYYKIQNIMPILGEGAKPIFVNGISSLSIFSDIILLNILMPYTKNLNLAKSGIKKGLIIAAAVAFITVLAYCLAYEYPASEDYMLPMYQLMKMIHISNFFSRFEAFFQFIWSILIFLYSSIYVFAMCAVLQETFSLKYSKPLIIPITLISTAIARLPGSVSDTVKFTELVSVIQVPIVFLLPIALGLLSLKYDRRQQ
ncbi:MAG: endospore germination permease [Firmicutes bacterium]|nr:endospore germination permease [Bacillota bacterium]